MKITAPVLRLAFSGLLSAVAFTASLPAQTPPPPAKRLPPPGVVLSSAARAELMSGVAALRAEIDALKTALAQSPNSALLHLLPDVEVFHKAVDWPLRHDEFFDLKQITTARHLLETGRARAAHLRSGTAPWTQATGLVIRGYQSKLDDSFQPYALVIPAEVNSNRSLPRRLDVVLAGRGEKRSELAFIDDHEKKPGEIVPPAAIVLHPYGRYCNATKFGGEVDVFEAMAAVKRDFAIDPERIVVRGFSMGGASTWHLATHFPGVWAAAAPGAGFAETAAYTKALSPGKPPRTDWEQKLWRWYDATGYAANLSGVPTVAYSGEIDPQKQAADIMSQAMAAEGLKLEHLIGPQTAHKYHPETKATLTARLDEILVTGRNPWPTDDRLTTYTPRYSQSRRIQIMELEQPWERSEVHVRFPSAKRLEVTTRNVGGFSVRLQTAEGLDVTVDGQPVKLGRIDPSYWFVKENGTWQFLDHAAHQARAKNQWRKTPGLSGPIDDAFLEPFLFVRPTGKALNEKVGTWVEAELRHAAKMWRDLFRGDVLIKDDTSVTAEDLAQRNVVLWGDPTSNRLLAKLLATGKLPLTWDAKSLTFRGRSYDAAHHAPILVFPNPLSSAPRYVVLNSGIDFRDEGYGTNALQTPKLPDFAIVDLREAPGPRWPGKIVDAGFFDANWK